VFYPLYSQMLVCTVVCRWSVEEAVGAPCF
jgi:hypothetical protein